MRSIYLRDIPDERLNDMVDYCHANNLSLEKFENIDVSDVSYHWDTIAMFCFTKDDDAMLFKLKYACN